MYVISLTYLNLKTFGSLWFASSLENNRNKLEPRSIKCIFVRYKLGIKAYIFLFTKNREIFINRNVIFYENIFPYKNSDDISDNNHGHNTENNYDF